MINGDFVTIDGREVPIEGEPNILELARKANIEIPTFCYHSDLSVYGACRLCLVEIEGRGIVTSCSTAPEPGMKVKTNTEKIREIRKIAVELLLANHEQQCATCPKSGSCKLQSISRRLGVSEVRFKPSLKPSALDTSSPSLVRDPNKCVLCGDCVRMCSEVQGIGAIDFTHRGADVQVAPAFDKDLAQVECVNCGQCASVCPTGAITPKSDVEKVWQVLHNPDKKVVAQIAPAVRVALGEAFGLEPGVVTTGQIVAALKAIGFDKVFDTCFAADLTVIEEGAEFLQRVERGERLPQFTSCCPGWVKFAEQYYPELLPNLSSCKSPQQMFGSIGREVLPAQLGVSNENLVIVSIMPCTAKKFEAKRSEFEHEGVRDVDYVLTTQELAHMIDEAGLKFNRLQPESLDLPLGFKTGAGVIFGVSGGVTEAVLRLAAEKLGGVKLDAVDFHEVRGMEGLREASVTVNDKEIRIAIVNGLANARAVAEKIKAGEINYDLIEVMACPGGCIGGAGQPVSFEPDVKKRRAAGLYEADKTLQLHKAQENPYVQEAYKTTLGEVGGHKAHELLHTGYHSRRRITDENLELVSGQQHKLQVNVCVGTSCYLRGSQDLLRALIHRLEDEGLADTVDVKATFCFERCDRGPVARVGEQILERTDVEKVMSVVKEELAKVTA
ncbi:MAG: NADH-dependent [FeFe] hydrogenase, group A6 [Armatimonadia bacterium]